ESLKKAVPGISVTALLPSQPPRPQATAAGSSSVITNEMVKKGGARFPSEKRHMVDNASSLDLMQKTRWFADWINNPSEHTIDLGLGEATIPSSSDSKLPLFYIAFSTSFIFFSLKNAGVSVYMRISSSMGWHPEQVTKIYELCGSADESNWPGCSKLPLYHKYKASRPMKRRVREVFRQFDRNALELLEKMLTLDPSLRISAKDALDAEYFWADPLPCDPKSLPNHHQYGKPRGPPGGPNRYPPGGNPNPSGYYQDRSTGQGGAGFNTGPYPPHARGPSASGPRGSSAGYGPGPQNYPQQYGAGGRGPNVPGNVWQTSKEVGSVRDMKMSNDQFMYLVLFFLGNLGFRFDIASRLILRGLQPRVGARIEA
nr:cyclin-dependent kinase C-2-like [Tanacetum cinerariifolium]